MIALLTLLASVRVTGYYCHVVTGMFAILAVWAALGFAFPADPPPLALNVISKILCFVAAIKRFVCDEDGSSIRGASDAPRPPGKARGRSADIPSVSGATGTVAVGRM